MSVSDEKSRLRRTLKEAGAAFLSATTSAQREAFARDVFDQIERSDAFRNARTVLLYASLPDEVPTGSVLARWSSSRQLVLPLVEGETLRLKRYSPEGVRPGYQGILEPLESCPEVAPGEIDLAIVPARAYTREGARLGRGKGYYDRLLPLLDKAVKVGAAFPFQMVESLPVEEWDVRLDAVYSLSFLG